MIFSCCDWETAMVQDHRNKLDFQEISVFNTDTKRVRKMNEKETYTVSRFMEQSSEFDVDAVMR